MDDGAKRLPRLIHDTEGVVLLVSALCSNGHLVYLTDPRLMTIDFTSLHWVHSIIHGSQ